MHHTSLLIIPLVVIAGALGAPGAEGEMVEVKLLADRERVDGKISKEVSGKHFEVLSGGVLTLKGSKNVVLVRDDGEVRLEGNENELYAENRAEVFYQGGVKNRIRYLPKAALSAHPDVQLPLEQLHKVGKGKAKFKVVEIRVAEAKPDKPPKKPEKVKVSAGAREDTFLDSLLSFHPPMKNFVDALPAGASAEEAESQKAPAPLPTKVLVGAWTISDMAFDDPLVEAMGVEVRGTILLFDGGKGFLDASIGLRDRQAARRGPFSWESTDQWMKIATSSAPSPLKWTRTQDKADAQVMEIKIPEGPKVEMKLLRAK